MKLQQKGAEEFQQEEFEAHLSDKNNRKKKINYMCKSCFHAQ